MRLIVTRPEPDDGRTAEALRTLGHKPLLSPMLDIVLEPAKPLPDRNFQAVLVTSSNAVLALANHPQRDRLAALPLLAVGDRTALEARRAGFRNARSAGGAVPDVVALARSSLDAEGRPLLYAAGENQAGDLAQALGGAGFSVDTVVVYRAEPRTSLADETVAALRAQAVDGVLVYSQRSAAAFALALRAAGLAPLSADIACFSMSEPAAEPLKAVARGPILVPERPDQISLFSVIERFEAGRTSTPAKA